MTLEDIISQLADFGYKLEGLSQNIHIGLHKSRQRGSGFNYERTVPFEDDPDPRRINWTVSIEEQEFYVDQFNEERTVNVVEIGDFSASALFGSGRTKVERIALLRAAIAFSAGKHRDRMMAIGVTTDIEDELTFPLDSRKDYYREIAGKTLAFNAVRGGGGLLKAVDLLPRTSSLVFLLSDFLDEIDYYRSVLGAMENHTVIPIVLRDPMELDVPGMKGIASYEDVETNKSVSVWMGKRGRRAFTEKAAQNRARLEALFAEFDIECLWLDGTRPDIEALVEYFEGKEGT